MRAVSTRAKKRPQMPKSDPIFFSFFTEPRRFGSLQSVNLLGYKRAERGINNNYIYYQTLRKASYSLSNEYILKILSNLTFKERSLDT